MKDIIFVVLILTICGSVISKEQFTLVKYKTNDLLDINGYLLPPDQKTLDLHKNKHSCPVLIITHDCDGIFKDKRVDNKQVIKEFYQNWGEKANKLGLFVFLIDSFSSRNLVGNQCKSSQLSDVKNRAFDLIYAYKYLTNPKDNVKYASYIDPSKFGVLGFGSGGTATLAAVATETFDKKQKNAKIFNLSLAVSPDCTFRGEYGIGNNSFWQNNCKTYIFEGIGNRFKKGGNYIK